MNDLETFFIEQADLNEDGVPMNETDASHIWRGWLTEAGYYNVRIENIGLSLPDLFWVYKGVVIFNETKVRRGNIVYAPYFQFSNMARMSNYMHKWQLDYVVYNGGRFDLYHFKDIMKDKDAHDSQAAGKVKILIHRFEPYMSIHNAYELENTYTSYIQSCAFPKKKQ
jgi:hypothetical protein